MTNFSQDLVYTLRTLRKSPLFVFVAAVTLAFGIGVNTTVFSLVNALLLRPLPVAAPEKLADVFTSSVSKTPYSTSSYPDYLDFRSQSDAFEGLAGYSMMFANYRDRDRNEVIFGELATGNYWQVLGVSAALGRTFGPEDNVTPGAHRVTVISDSFWRERFAADPDVLGREVVLNGHGYTVLGVAPPEFTGLVPALAADLWIPAMMVNEVEPVGWTDLAPGTLGQQRLQERGFRWMFLKGRLKDGTSVEQAGQQLSVVMSRLSETYRETNEERQVRVVAAGNVRFHPDLDRVLKSAMTVTMGLFSLVLLITCANLANMLLSRASERRREIAIRLAMGASRKRLITQLLNESLFLALIGAFLAWLLAFWTTRLLLSYQPSIPFSLTLDLQFDVRVLLFTTAIALFSAFIFGLVPALQASNPNLVEALKTSGRTAGASGKRFFSLRNILVMVQVAVSLILLIVASLLGRSALAAENTDVGLDTERVAVLAIHLGMQGYQGEEGEVFLDQLLDRVRSMENVETATVTTRPPFAVNPQVIQLYIDGFQSGPEDPPSLIDTSSIENGFFEIFGIPLLQGRDFSSADRPETQRVAIVNETMARLFWSSSAEAIGQTVKSGRFDGPRVQIVGVVGDHKIRTVSEPPRPIIYFFREQQPASSIYLVARGLRGDADTLASEIQQTSLSFDPDLAFPTVTTLEGMMGVSLFPLRVGAAMLGIFGALALLLAAVGLYGVIAFAVNQRIREMCIRTALGASRRSILFLVLKRGMQLAAVGIVAGLVVSLFIANALSGALVGISAIDPLSFIGSILTILLVVLLANLMPALKASRVDPQQVLRQE